MKIHRLAQRYSTVNDSGVSKKFVYSCESLTWYTPYCINVGGWILDESYE